MAINYTATDKPLSSKSEEVLARRPDSVKPRNQISGWECPLCGKVYSPLIASCEPCEEARIARKFAP